MSTIIDHTTLAVTRLVTQFKESTNLINYIKTLLVEANTLEEVYRSLLEDRWLDVATGVNLDILGSIVGQPREFIDAEIFDYFGFADNSQAQSFGTVLDVGVGGRFVRVGEITTGIRRLEDEEYRAFIRSRISRNSTSSTPEDIIAQLQFILNTPLILLVEGQARYEISIGRKLTLNEKSILAETNIVPKTAGVSTGYVTEFSTDDFFSFGGVPNGEGFGSVLNSSLGGRFGNLIF